MTEKAVYRRGAVLWRCTYDRVLILVPGEEGFLSLQGTGRDLWDVLEEPGTLDELAARLAGIYTAPAGRIASEIVNVIEELERRGAVVSAHPRDGL